MMEEMPSDDGNQWASFSTFDFTQISPTQHGVGSDQWPPANEDDQVQHDLTQLPQAEGSEADGSRRHSVDESLVDVSDDTREESYESERLLEMEEEQDMLNASLISLTTHFAQVQFRLKQISSADDIQTKEKLIKDLELFAFEGCPDVRGVVAKSQIDSLQTEAEHEANHEKQVVETKELIQRLQKQLTDVEQWAYESGQAEPPSMAVLERQKVILDTLRERVKLSVDGYERLPPEQLRLKIDEAIEAIISPYRKKEVAQERTLNNMQTLLDDLERYIGHLHQPGTAKEAVVESGRKPVADVSKSGSGSKEAVDPRSLPSRNGTGYVTNIIHRTYNVLQFFAFMNWACLREKRFHKNEMKSTMKGNHWGDVRAVLEVTISRVAEAARLQHSLRPGLRRRQESYQDDVAVSEDQLTKLVRKDLSSALCNLMKHGLIHLSNETSLVPRMMCTSRRTEDEAKELHPWEFLLKYYAYKNGSQFNRSATKKLSDSFQLSSVGHKAMTPMDTLLGTIGQVIESHSKLKRSSMTHFKAFICAALNQKSLSVWLRLIYCTRPLIDEYYMPWSYAVKTHFEDACRSLDSLTAFHFSLSADLAVKPFSNLNDAF